MADPVSLLVTVGLNIGFSALQNALADPIRREGPRLNDLKVSVSTYGVPIFELFGSLPLRGNVVWSAGIEEVKNVQKQGGKGGSPKQETTTYSYYWTGGVSFGKGPMRSLNKLFLDGKLVFDQTSSAGVDTRKNGLSFRYYPGSETQLADSLYEELTGSNLAPAFRGQAVIVFERLPLADYGNRIPNITAEFTRYTGSGDADPQIVEEDSTPIAGGTFNSFHDDCIVPDRERNLIYCQDKTGSPQGLRVLDRSDMTEIRQSPNLVDRNISGTAITSLDLKCVTRNGFPVLQFNAGNSQPMVTISPDTLDIAGKFGFQTDQFEYNEFSHTSTRIARVTPERCASMQVLSEAGVFTFLFAAGDVSDNATLFRVSDDGTITYLWSDAFSNIPCVVGPVEPGFKENRFWFFDTPEYTSPDSGSVTLYEMVVGVDLVNVVLGTLPRVENNVRQIATFTPANLFPGATTLGALSLVYDQVDGSLIVVASEDGIASNQAYVTKLDPSDGSAIWQTAVDFMRNDPTGAAWTEVTDGYLVQMLQSDAWAIRTSDGELIREESSISTSLGSTSAHYYEGSSGSVVGLSGGEPFRWFFWREDRVPALLSDVVTDICGSVGLTSSDIDVSELTAVEVDGYVLTRQVPARQALEELSSVYQFDGVESDFQLKFPLRDGKSSVAAITEADLAAIDASGNLLANRITQEVELPLSVNVRYLSAARDHQEQSHQVKRAQNPTPTMYSTNPVSVTFSGVLNEAEAKQTAETLLFSAWSERFGKKALLPWEYLTLDPTDVVTITLDSGDSFRLRLVNVEVGGALQIDAEAVVEDALQFTSTVAADAPSAASNTFLSVPFTKLLLLNTPLLRNRDDVGRTYSQLYFAMGGYGGSGWRAGHLYESTDTINFNHEGVTTTEAAWGIVTDPLPDTRFPHMLDADTTLTVRLRSARELESITLAELQAGGNAAVIVRAYDGKPEIFQFQTATENADGTWTLSNLVRGRRGTSSFADNHAAGDVFVLLEPGALGLTDLELSEIGSARYYKGVTESGTVEEAPTTTNTSPGNDLMPYPPVSLRSTSGLPGSDMTLEWMRQSRIVTGLVDGDYDPPLAEDSEEYILQILGGKNGTNELREVTSLSSETYTYTAANQSTDYGGGFVDMTSTLLTNAGFEEGDLTGWSVDAGAGAVAMDGEYSFGDGFISGADEGTRFCVFYFDAADPSAVTISQTFTLADLEDAILAGNAQVRASAAFASNVAATDSGRIDLVWLDVDGAEISTTTGSEVDPDNSGSWTTQTETVSAGDVPREAKSCRLEIHGTLNDGSRINVAVDDVTLEFDHGGIPDQVSFRVAQVSGQVGTGFWSRGQAISTVADA